ncbi:hypothetical protein H4R35_004070 [Dimargaris xerosporica]|nr:hypothetical protein H4R35_004070 [Dimargaris xerosporica]
MTTSVGRILVVGGSGFLGTSVCRVALQRGLQVVSLSRRGAPIRPHPTAPRPAWQEQVQWQQGDALQPDTYAKVAQDCHGIVHTVGTLLEADYKPLIKAGSVCQAASQWRSMRTTPTAVNYQRMNRDTALEVARTAAKSGAPKTFVYISASDVLPFIDRRYISTKREAEAELLKMDALRTVVLRPGIMYSEQQPLTMSVATVLGIVGQAKKSLLNMVSRTQPPVSAGLATPPLHTDIVARAVVTALCTERIKGVVNPDGIIELASCTSGYIKRGNKLVRVCSETDASLPNVASLRPLSITKPKRPLPSRHLKLINPQATVQGDANSSYSSLTKPQWVQRRTRHMQLINAKVASQLTPRPLSSRRRRAREIAIGKAVFVLDRTGKKLKRKLSALDLAKHSLASPTTLRDAKAFTKTGRRALVRTAILGGNTVVRKRKSSTGKYCTFYNRFGRCSAGNQCPFIHDPNRVALCTRFLRGMCSAGDSCPFSHDRRPERVPLCYHFQRGQCHKPQCPYIHVRMSPEAPICRSFMYEGFCPKGKDCEYRHVYECPEFAETGECQRPKCRWPHIHRRKTARGPDAPLSAPSHSTSLADKSEPSTLESKRPPPPRSQRYMEMASLEPEENSTGDASLSQTDAAAKQESKATTIADDYDFIAFDD